MTKPRLARYNTELFIVRQIRKTIIRIGLLTAAGAVVLFFLTPRLQDDIYPRNIVYGLELLSWVLACLTGIFTLAMIFTLLDVPVYKGEAETEE